MYKSGMLLLLLFALTGKAVSAQETDATRLLKERTNELRDDIIEVADGVYAAVGYSVSNVSMVVGDDGVIIIDTGMDVPGAQKILEQFRKITNKPVRAIIYTHSHGDHTGGASVFAGKDNPQVWASANYGAESADAARAGLTINGTRGAHQAGMLLPPEQRINNGVAPVYYPRRGGEAFSQAGSGEIKPTHTFTGREKIIRISGVELKLVATGGETDDQLYVWLPGEKVIFSGDNFYRSWPNLYPIRGAMYRDILDWANSLDMMIEEGPAALVPGHTRPFTGAKQVVSVLTNYRNAIRYVFDKTIDGMNKGMVPGELVEYVKLPDSLAHKDYIRPYYGNPAWAVRAIFSAYLGWYDGNPTNLFPLSPVQEAKQMAELAGGRGALLDAARNALDNKEFQWAAQLCDHLLALDNKAAEPKLIKADALTALAENLLTATGRNYYLTTAQQLQKKAGN